jgi:hypothetical protein
MPLLAADGFLDSFDSDSGWKISIGSTDWMNVPDPAGELG